MEIRPSSRLLSLTSYPFADIDRIAAHLRSEGVEPIDFGVGDPILATAPLVHEALHNALSGRKDEGYPSYEGASFFREAAAEWMKKKLNVDMDPETEIIATIGSKEAIFNFHEGLVEPGDTVLLPSPGYPPCYRGTLFAEGVPVVYPLLKEQGFLPPLDMIPSHVADRARLMWINYPNNPTGAVAAPHIFEELVSWAAKKEIVLASDEAYLDLTFHEPHPSILQFAGEGVIAFFSLSKRSAMTGYRVGWAAGDQRIIEILKKVKTNIDSGVPTFVQEGAASALRDESHVETLREEYKRRRDILVKGLDAAGLNPDPSPATLYLWHSVPAGFTSESFMRRLLEPEPGLITIPGPWLGEATSEGLNPGEGYVRFALSPSIQETREAAQRLSAMKGEF